MGSEELRSCPAGIMRCLVDQGIWVKWVYRECLLMSVIEDYLAVFSQIDHLVKGSLGRMMEENTIFNG